MKRNGFGYTVAVAAIIVALAFTANAGLNLRGVYGVTTASAVLAADATAGLQVQAFYATTNAGTVSAAGWTEAYSNTLATASNINATVSSLSAGTAYWYVWRTIAAGVTNWTTPALFFTVSALGSGESTLPDRVDPVTNGTFVTTLTMQAPAAQTPTITVVLQATTAYDSTGAPVSNALGQVMSVVTGVTATCSTLPVFVTNATAVTTPTWQR